MTTATRSVAVVATRLPNIDRRVLSQAWYSALHIPEPPAPGATGHPATTMLPPNGNLWRAAPPCTATPIAPGGGAVRVGTARLTPMGPPGVERRGAAGDLARRIERAVARRVARGPVRRAAVAIEAGSGRVHLLIQTDGVTTRIVALCAPHLRERVDRALAHARFALAASGTRIVVAQ